MNYLRFSQTKNESYPVVCAREGGQTQLLFKWHISLCEIQKIKQSQKKP